MKTKLFIQTNNKQSIGAFLAKHALETVGAPGYSVEIINVDIRTEFKDFVGKTYLRAGQLRTYTLDDLQSFTLTRFMPPELINFSGRALVIDPDIFALQNIEKLLKMDLKGRAIACCQKAGKWDTSVMLLDCEKLRHWKISTILEKMAKHELDYIDLFGLKGESCLEIPRIYNNLDVFTPETKLIHTTNRLTQPWKTGLKIDFTRNKAPKLFGFIPREPILKLRGKLPNKYQPHPDKKVERLFVRILKNALADNGVTKQQLENAVLNKDVRPDIFDLLEKV